MDVEGRRHGSSRDVISQSRPYFSKQSQAGNDSDTFENSAKLLPLARVLKNSARQPFTTYPKNKATGTVRYCINGSNSPLFIGRLHEPPNAGWDDIII